MKEQWLQLRRGLPRGAILFVRLGDYVETFYSDAKRLSEATGLQLVQRPGFVICGDKAHKLLELAKAIGAPCYLTEDRKTVTAILTKES